MLIVQHLTTSGKTYKVDKELFKQDILELLSHSRGGHAGKWVYADTKRPSFGTGAELWHDFVTANNNYYPIRAEIDLIPTLLNGLAKNYDTVIDFGIGDEFALNGKTLPILLSQENLRKYAPIDISRNELDNGLLHLKSKLKGIHTQAIESDFYSPKAIEGHNKLGLFLGTTISNQDMMVGEKLPRETIVNRLKTLKETTHGSGDSSLIISLDTNPDLNHALDAYQHISWVRMMTGLMYDIQTHLKPEGNFTPSMWHYAPVIDKENHVIQQVLSPSIDQDIVIDGQEFNVKKGDQFVAINNFKYPLDLFKEMIEEAGLVPYKAPITSDEHSMCFIEAVA